jgi:hypothetical protein
VRSCFVSFHCTTEYRPTRNTWQSSHTRTGLADDGNDIVLSEHALQNISPQLRQWCCKKQNYYHKKLNGSKDVLVDYEMKFKQDVNIKKSMENLTQHMTTRKNLLSGGDCTWQSVIVLILFLFNITHIQYVYTQKKVQMDYLLHIWLNSTGGVVKLTC